MAVGTSIGSSAATATGSTRLNGVTSKNTCLVSSNESGARCWTASKRSSGKHSYEAWGRPDRTCHLGWLRAIDGGKPGSVAVTRGNMSTRVKAADLGEPSDSRSPGTD